MPHPTPAQLVSGSVTVVGSALALLLLLPSGSALALTAVAAVSLTLGTVAALAAAPERAARNRRAHARSVSERAAVRRP
ncbi:hypothetical protein [Streptomyces avicenniae]|uniref:hypothetical protein n=1 Tax=Streptomyces avicenniae TaxID=500153 RepID=UPI00069CA208|nr:hypothetical protein [Streptomyces avicenniae]